MRPRYSAYVTTWMRFYTKYRTPVFRSDEDRLNWQTCDIALSSLGEDDRKTVLSVYCGNGRTMNENVGRVAKVLRQPPSTVWKLIRTFEQRVARSRGFK